MIGSRSTLFRSFGIIITSAFCVTSSDAKVIYVDASASGLENGTDWENAYTNPQDALAASAAGDDVWVAAGTYKPTSGSDRTVSFAMKNDVSLLGGFVTGATSIEERNPDPATNGTVLSGEIGDPDTTEDNTYRIVIGPSSGSAIFDGFRIVAGNANSYPNYNQGAGLYALTGVPICKNLLFEGNSSGGFGGAVSVGVSSPTFTNCVFRNNHAGRGGAFAGSSSTSPVFDRCVFLSNVSDIGGALYLQGPGASLTNCIFKGNVGSIGAGAIHDGSSTASTYRDCLFSGNSGINGGAVEFGLRGPSFINCVFSGNQARDNGGAVSGSSGSPSFTNCIIWNNEAGGKRSGTSASLYKSSASNPARFAHCIVENSGGSANWNTAVGSNLGDNLDQDPLFVSPPNPAWAPHAQGDLHLLPTSPAIDAGKTDANPLLVDLDGNPRVITQIDLGPYEYDSSLLIPNSDSPTEHRLLAIEGQAYPDLLDLALLFNRSLDSATITEVSPDAPFSAALNADKKLSLVMSGVEGSGSISFSVTSGDSSTDYVLKVRALGPVIHVNPVATGSGDGTSWDDAFDNLQTGLMASEGSTAGPSRQMWVARGIHKPTAGTDRTISFVLKDGLALYGGFVGNEANLGERNADPLKNETILSGEIGDPTNLYDNSVVVVTAFQIGNTAIIDGLTITNNHTRNNTPYLSGDFLDGNTPFHCNGASPVIRNCLFADSRTRHTGGAVLCEDRSAPVIEGCYFYLNSNYWSGGAIGIVDSTATVTRSHFDGNEGRVSGGAIYLWDGSVEVTDCTFAMNTSGGGPGGAIFSMNSTVSASRCIFAGSVASTYGGAISANGSEILITDCFFVGNSSPKGGAAALEASEVTFTRCQFEDNQSGRGGAMWHKTTTGMISDSAFVRNKGILKGGQEGTGGAIAAESGSAPFSNCQFIGNTARTNGGAFVVGACPNLSIDHCLFEANTAGANGGAISGSGQPAFVTGGLFVGNRATVNGGALFNYAPFVTSLINSTFSGNSAGTSGGAIYNSSIAPTIVNTIIWNNVANNSSTSTSSSIGYGGAQRSAISYSLIANSGGGTWNPDIGTDNGHNLASDPLFVAPYNFTVTGGGSWNLRLAEGSPAINAGDDIANAGTTDLDGHPRRRPGTLIDLGPYEYDPTLVVTDPEQPPLEEYIGTVDWEQSGCAASWTFDGITITNGRGRICVANGISNDLNEVIILPTSGETFTPYTIDLSEYSASSVHPIHFIGTRRNGGTVTFTFTPDGVFDGPGGLNDFESIQFPEDFVSLVKLEIHSEGFAFDNLTFRRIISPPFEGSPIYKKGYSGLTTYLSRPVGTREALIGEDFYYTIGNPLPLTTTRLGAEPSSVAIQPLDFDEVTRDIFYRQGSSLAVHNPAAESGVVVTIQNVFDAGYVVNSIDMPRGSDGRFVFVGVNFVSTEFFYLFELAEEGIVPIVSPDSILPSPSGTGQPQARPRFVDIEGNSTAFDTSLVGSATKRVYASFEGGAFELLTSEGDVTPMGTITVIEKLKFLGSSLLEVRAKTATGSVLLRYDENGYVDGELVTKTFAPATLGVTATGGLIATWGGNKFIAGNGVLWREVNGTYVRVIGVGDPVNGDTISAVNFLAVRETAPLRVLVELRYASDSTTAHHVELSFEEITVEPPRFGKSFQHSVSKELFIPLTHLTVGKDYWVQTSPNLVDWTDAWKLPEVFPQQYVIIPPSILHSPSFFRVQEREPASP
jgi:predicted outer membrane repeat protein